MVSQGPDLLYPVFSVADGLSAPDCAGVDLRPGKSSDHLCMVRVGRVGESHLGGPSTCPLIRKDTVIPQKGLQNKWLLYFLLTLLVAKTTLVT